MVEGRAVALVRKERLELSRVAPLEPKSSASTNSATLAQSLAPHAGNGVATSNQYDRGKKMVGRVGFEPTTY